MQWVTRLFRVAFVLAVAVVAARGAEDADRPNIILCMADDQGWGDVAYNGHPDLKTPALDDMASEGLVFNRFYAAAPVCSPTRASVLTGRHPNRMGVFKWGHTLRPQEVTVAEALKRAGYRTAHFGKWHLGPMLAGRPASPGESGFDHWISSPNFYDLDPLFSRNGEVVEKQGESSLVTMGAALKFIRDEAEKDRPFLAVIWFGSPHGPHKAAPKYRRMYKDFPKPVRNYYGEVTAIDDAVGRLRRALRRLGIARNTLLWYTSDNGARSPGSNGGLRAQKGTLWEGGIRVPAIIEWPARISEQRTTDLPANTVDIYPTLLDVVGVDVPDQPKPIDGTSLLPLIRGEMAERSKPMGFWQYPGDGRGVHSRRILQKIRAAQSKGKEVFPGPWDQEPAKIAKTYSPDRRPGHAAWIDGDYKLHRIPKDDGGAEYRLFDLEDDPKEQKDLSDDQPDRVERMKKGLKQWQRSVVGSLNGKDYD